MSRAYGGRSNTITKMVLRFVGGRIQDLRLNSVAEEGGDSGWYIRDRIVFPVEQVSNFGVGFDLGVHILDEVGERQSGGVATSDGADIARRGLHQYRSIAVHHARDSAEPTDLVLHGAIMTEVNVGLLAKQNAIGD